MFLKTPLVRGIQKHLIKQNKKYKINNFETIHSIKLKWNIIISLTAFFKRKSAFFIENHSNKRNSWIRSLSWLLHAVVAITLHWSEVLWEHNNLEIMLDRNSKYITRKRFAWYEIFDFHNIYSMIFFLMFLLTNDSYLSQTNLIGTSTHLPRWETATSTTPPRDH